MSVHVTDAVVLNRHLMGDSSLLVTLYTRDLGKIKLVARGARRPKSRLTSALQPFTLISVTFRRKDHRDLQTLGQADVLTVYRRLGEDLTRMSYAGAVVELINRLVIGEEPAPELYDLLTGTLHTLNTLPVEGCEALFWQFQLQLAGLFGYAPMFSACAACDRALDEITVTRFSPALGGILCPRCLAQDHGAFLVSVGTIKLLSRIQSLSPDLLARMKSTRSGRQETIRVIRSLYLYHMDDGRELKALKFLESIEENPVPDAAAPAPKSAGEPLS